MGSISRTIYVKRGDTYREIVDDNDVTSYSFSVSYSDGTARKGVDYTASQTSGGGGGALYVTIPTLPNHHYETIDSRDYFISGSASITTTHHIDGNPPIIYTRTDPYSVNIHVVIDVSEDRVELSAAPTAGVGLDLVEGGARGGVHISLSHPVKYAITINANASGPNAQDFDYSPSIVIPAGASGGDYYFQAKRDNILESIESSVVTLSANSLGYVIPIGGSGIFNINAKDEFTDAAAVDGALTGKVIANTIMDGINTGFALSEQTGKPADAGPVFKALGDTANKIAVPVTVLADANILVERLNNADRLAHTDVDGAARYAYAAYETAFVESDVAMADFLLASAPAVLVAGALFGFSGGVPLIVTLPALIAQVGSGKSGEIYYEQTIAPRIQKLMIAEFERAHPKQQFIDNFIKNHPLSVPGEFGVLKDGGSGLDVQIGTPNRDKLNGGAGNDVLDGRGGNDLLDGGSGLDTAVIHSMRIKNLVEIQSNKLTIFSADGFTEVVNVERIQFDDAVVAFDTQSNAGDAYRLYQAAFNRTPDVGGLSYWTHGLDIGINIQAISQGFVNSAEFKQVYGANPTNSHIIDLFYQNVLGRAGEAGGVAYWLNALNIGVPISEVLQGFAVSAENHAIVDPKLVQGIVLDHSAFLV